MGPDFMSIEKAIYPRSTIKSKAKLATTKQAIEIGLYLVETRFLL